MNRSRKYVIIWLSFFAFSNFVKAEKNEIVNCVDDYCVYPTNNPAVSDAIEIQNAINVAFLQGKNLCLETNRVYELDRKVFGYGISIEGNNATLQIKTGVTNDFFLFQYSSGTHLSYGIPYDNSDFFIRNLNIDGNRDNINITESFKLSYMFTFLSSNRVLIENCNFKNVANTAIYIQDSRNISIESSSFIDIGPCANPLPCYCINGADQCPFVGCGPHAGSWDAISMVSYNYIENIRITNSHFENIGVRTYEHACTMDADAISTWAGALPGGEVGQIDGIILTGNYFENIARRCLKLQSGSFIQVTDNVAYNVGRLVANVMETNERIIRNEIITNNVVSDVGMFLENAGFVPKAEFLSINSNISAEGVEAFNWNGGSSSVSNASYINNVVTSLDAGPESGVPAYIWGGEGQSCFIMNNIFEYNPKEMSHSIIINDPEWIRIEGNDFSMKFSDVEDKTPILLGNQNIFPGYNIIRHNRFDTIFGTDTENIISTNLHILELPRDSSNILLID